MAAILFIERNSSTNLKQKEKMKKTILAVAAMMMMGAATADAQIDLGRLIQGGAKVVQAIKVSDADMAAYVKEYIDPNAPGGKEHIGYIVDRTGFEEFKRWALKGVVLSDKAEVMSPMYWKGIKY